MVDDETVKKYESLVNGNWAKFSGDKMYELLDLISFNIKLVNQPAKPNGYTFLHVAAKHGKQDFLQSIIPGLDITVKDNDGNTPMHIAAENKQYTTTVRIFELSIRELGAKAIKSAGGTPSKPLVMIEMVKYLKNNDGNTPLHLAAKVGSLFTVDNIIQYVKLPSLINSKNKKGQTALHLAAEGNHKKSLKILIKAPGVDVNVIDKKGKTALDVAVEGGHNKAAKTLRAAGGKTGLDVLKDLTAKAVQKYSKDPKLQSISGKLLNLSGESSPSNTVDMLKLLATQRTSLIKMNQGVKTGLTAPASRGLQSDLGKVLKKALGIRGKGKIPSGKLTKQIDGAIGKLGPKQAGKAAGHVK